MSGLVNTLGDDDQTAVRINSHIIGKSAAVIIPARIAAFLESRAGITSERRSTLRGSDDEAYEVLAALRVVALAWRGGQAESSPGGTKLAVRQQESIDWLTTTEAARLTGVTPRAIRKRIANKQLPAERRGQQWWVSRQHLNIVSALPPDTQRKDQARWTINPRLSNSRTACRPTSTR